MKSKDALVSAGKPVGKIPVKLSYHIIEHFSKGLYSSPNKALEELVSNSYDALANIVEVVLPDNVKAQDAVIWVVDNGQSMDATGLAELWQIGVSRKRDAGRQHGDRLPIGKFGIGKLATYVLGKTLTFVTKSKSLYRAVTMDYSRVEQSNDDALDLDLRELTEAQAKKILEPLLKRKDSGARALPLFGPKSPSSWTVAAMSSLTELSQDLTTGRLRWVLSTALPLNPSFRLYLNGQSVTSSKETKPLIETWQIGADDAVAAKLGFDVRGKGKTSRVVVPQLGEISGEVQLFEDALTEGKADKWARSNGFFVRVRRRVINPREALFGLEPLSHGAFSRFRMEVNADGLDEYLRSSRESVLETAPGVVNFRTYLQEKFNEARVRYARYLDEQDTAAKESFRLNRTPLSLSRQPLLRAIAGVLDGSHPPLLLSSVPQNLSEDDAKQFFDTLADSEESDAEFFKEVSLEALGVDDFLARFDAVDRIIRINTLHPFFANFEEHYRSPTPFKLIAVAEVLTEAYLIEEGLSAEQVRTVIRRRDRLLRELVYSTQLAAPLVAELLRDNVADEKGLEEATYQALSSLGFEVSKIGGNGKPDGLASARLGVRDAETGASASYTFTYDAKSTGRDRVKAKDANVAGIVKHRTDYNADFCLLVAPAFEGEEDDTSNINDHARTHGVTLIRVDDLIALVLIAATRQLSLTRLRELFATRTTRESHDWIAAVLAEDTPVSPLPELLATIWEMQKDTPDPVTFSAVRERLARSDQKTFGSLRAINIKEWMQSLQRFAGRIVTVTGDTVSLEQRPDRILQEVRGLTGRLPEAWHTKTMYASLDVAAPDKAKPKKPARTVPVSNSKKRKR
jgi:hypothetical protein